MTDFLFVRTRDPGRHNLELLRRGEAMPDDWYRKKYGPWPEVGSAYFRPVTVTELVAVHWHNQGNDLRRPAISPPPKPPMPGPRMSLA